MKANYELGDWVIDTEFDRNRPDTIECLEPHRVWLTNGKLYQPIDTIEPIPLTAEILEKNGWIYIYYRDETDSLEELFANQELEFDIFRSNNYKIRCVDIADGIRIDYVHELQHALKLCGIDKQIKL